MKTYLKKATLVLMLVALTVMFSFSDVRAQEKGLAQQIQGTWSIVSIYNELDGKKSDVLGFGPNPRGTMILNPNGRFALIIMKASLPKFAVNNRAKGTAEENQAVVQGSIAFFGTYTAGSEKENIVNMRIEGSTFPNWDGQEQKRIMVVTGDEIKMTNPVPSVGGTNHLIWKRVK